MNEAIEKGLVLVERGIMKRDERDRKVSSLHIDEEEEEVSLPLLPLPTLSSYTALIVSNPGRAKKVIPRHL